MKDRKVGFWLSLAGGLIVFGIFRRALNYFLFYPTFFPKALEKPFWYLPKLLAETTQLHLIVALFVTVELVKHTLEHWITFMRSVPIISGSVMRKFQLAAYTRTNWIT